MRVIGVDIGAETPEEADGYRRLLELVGEAADTRVVMEATGHCWQNLFAALAARSFTLALMNRLRTPRFAEEELRRTKTDAIDALGVADFGAGALGAVPGLRQSGKRQGQRAGLHPLGHGRLRAQLWMPTLSAVRVNPWLRTYHERLIARGKLRKVAVVAALRKLLVAIYSVAKNRRPFVPHVRPQETPA
jgi:hypothetical protein